jgi:hypothetical protein
VPLPPPAVKETPFVPVTLVLDLTAVKGKLFQPGPAVPPPPGIALAPQPGPQPVVPAQPGPIFQPGPGKLLDKIREKKPLQKILGGLAAGLNVAQELEKLSNPVSLGDNLWLTMNLKEVVVQGVNVQGLNQAIIQLAARLEPTVVVSKDKPTPLPATRDEGDGGQVRH